MSYVIFNGELLKRNQAKIDIEDRGFQFGDGIYEVIAVYGNRPFALKEHLERLFASAKKIHMNIDYSKMELENFIAQLLKKNKIIDGYIYLQYTRGVSDRNHIIPQEAKGTLIAYILDIVPNNDLKRNGGKATVTEDIRWLRCDIKSISLIGNILVREEAVKRGNMEAILHREQTVTEGSASNVWIVKDGLIRTHPAGHFILNGITRQKVLQICKQNGLSFEERSFTLKEMYISEEVFLTSTTLEITPVIEIDGRKVGSGKPGPITQKLQQLFEQEKYLEFHMEGR